MLLLFAKRQDRRRTGDILKGVCANIGGFCSFWEEP